MITKTLPRMVSAAVRHAMPRCSAHPDMPTFTARTGCTGASITFPRHSGTPAAARTGPRALERLDTLGAASFGFLALLALAFDHFCRRAPDKIGVAELRVDAGDVARNLGHLLLEPATLRTEIDHALERQCREFPPDHELDCN